MPFSIKDDPMILREIIMDHYRNPRNKRQVEDPRYKKVHMDSASCIDDIYVQEKRFGTSLFRRMFIRALCGLRRKSVD